MKLSEFKKKLSNLNELNFVLSNGSIIPTHFHITEVGLTTKHFIDCGGTIREEKYVNFQFWKANDIDHRLTPSKLLDIITLSEKKLGIGDYEIEVEYQIETIGRFGLDFNTSEFVLTYKQTNCLASDKCGIQEEKINLNLAGTQQIKASCCGVESNCC